MRRPDFLETDFFDGDFDFLRGMIAVLSATILRGSPVRQFRTTSGRLSAKDAQKLARKSLLRAKSLAKKGRQGEAFQELLTSWQEVRQHKDNPSCRALANELQMALKDYGEQLNEVAGKNGAATSRKPLTVE